MLWPEERDAVALIERMFCCRTSVYWLKRAVCSSINPLKPTVTVRLHFQMFSAIQA